MKLNCMLIVLAFLAFSCGTPTEKKTEALPDIVGTWLLYSSTTVENDSTTLDLFENQKFIKVINPTHFTFLRHDLNKGKDSTAIFVAGGGAYTFDGTTYKETLEFCTAREWEGHSFSFTLTLKGDSLIQEGLEEDPERGISRHITERYIRTLK